MCVYTNTNIYIKLFQLNDEYDLYLGRDARVSRYKHMCCALQRGLKRRFQWLIHK